VARQARQPRWGTWRPNVGDGTVRWPPPGRPGQGIMTDLVFAPGPRIKCGRAPASQRSGAHTGHDVVLLQTPADVVLLQTPAAAKTADTGVKLSAEASRVVTSVRSVSHPHGVRVRCGRNAPGPTAPMAYERHLAATTSGHRPSQPAPVAPAGENAPAKVDLARIQAERGTSQRGPERINRQQPIKKPCRRRISRSASPLSRGVTTPDLPEGI
jgi:hypothetical protein